MRTYQENLLAVVLDIAFNDSPFYKDFYRHAGLERSDIKTIDDMRKLPILTKELFRTHSGTMLASGFPSDQRIFCRTSGSTGMRLTFYRDKYAGSFHLANQIRGRSWWGINPGDREIKFWGSAWDFETTVKGRLTAYARWLKDRAIGVLHLSAFKMKDSNLESAYKKLKKFKPKVVFGYGTALFMFADFIKRHYGTATAHRPEIVIYTSEYLSDARRSLIADVFRCPVVSEYGSVECGIHSYQCPAGCHHWSDETLLYEVIDSKGRPVEDGEGRLVITHLRERATPIIRYLIGDIVRIRKQETAACECGVKLSVLDSIRGRENDLLRSPDGDFIHPELFDYIMRYQSTVRRFRIIENDIGKLRILLESVKPLSTSDIDAVRNILDEHLGTAFDYVIEQVDVIPNEPSGKFRWVISKQK